MSVDERREHGRGARKTVPRSSFAEWTPTRGRADPIALLEGQNADRLGFLVPVRRGRMAESAFSFYRGAARVMATDQAAVPNSGLTVQLCGDAHLANFGAFASPERQLVFDVNDFDETLPGPFEWDVQRLAASCAIAGRHLGFELDTCRGLAAAAASAYRTTMERLAGMGWLDAWYTAVPVQQLIDLSRERGAKKKDVKKAEKWVARTKSKGHLRAAKKLVEGVAGQLRFRSSPPLLVPLRDLTHDQDPDALRHGVEVALRQYRRSLDDETRVLFDRYRPVDYALKVVGVGSVGTRCLIGLFVGDLDDDVLVLQVKEAGASVLEEHLPSSRYRLHGRRVVEGQRLMQASSDIFLGWSTSVDSRHYYWRQLKDWKGSVDLDDGSPDELTRYAGLCGFTLARSHAVSGDPAMISGYLGSSDRFDSSIAEFAVRYADQNDADYREFVAAIRDGRLEASTG